MNIETTTPALRTVRVTVTNLTDHQAAFLSGIIAILTDPTDGSLSLIERDRAALRMDTRTGGVRVLPDNEHAHLARN